MDDNGQSRFLGQQPGSSNVVYLRNMLWFDFKQMVNMGFYSTASNIYQPYPGDQHSLSRESRSTRRKPHIYNGIHFNIDNCNIMIGAFINDILTLMPPHS